MKRLLLLFVLLIFFAGSVFSLDFGLLVDQKLEAENKSFLYEPAFAPWFSWNGGKGLSVYLSGLFSLKYTKFFEEADGKSGLTFVPELSRFSINYRLGQRYYFEAGRVWYADVLGITASGLYDGLRFDAALPIGGIRAGLFYTGLLYKETAKILMTPYDEANYDIPLDWKSTVNYFASRRLFAAFRWDMPLGGISAFSLEALAQFDLNGGDGGLHSQYGEVQFEFFPRNLGITVGALFEAMETGGEFNAALGALARLRVELPGSLNHGLNVAMKFSSGAWSDTFTVYKPLSSPSQGAVFPGTLSGLALFSGGYSVRILDTLFAEGSLRYYMRTFNDPAAPGVLYGGEIWASLAWQPLDDISVFLGGGAFFPGLGNIAGDTLWKVSAGLSLSF